MIVELAGLGAVGRRLLSELLSTPEVELVRVRSRRPEVAAAQVGGADRVEVVGSIPSGSTNQRSWPAASAAP